MSAGRALGLRPGGVRIEVAHASGGERFEAQAALAGDPLDITEAFEGSD